MKNMESTNKIDISNKTSDNKIKILGNISKQINEIIKISNVKK